MLAVDTSGVHTGPVHELLEASVRKHGSRPAMTFTGPHLDL